MFREKHKPSNHHMIPRTRASEFPVYVHDPRNIKETTQGKHDAFNTLFPSNATPEEALLILVNEWFPPLKYYGGAIRNKHVLAFVAAIKDPMGSR